MVGALSCPQCGTAFGANDTFCVKCGTRVTPAPPTGGYAEASDAGITQVGVALRDDEDVMLQKIREMTVGEYEVRGLLGRGGMASVFVAYDITLNRKVALKVMHPGLLGDPGMRERFRLEARMAARLDHPNIVTVHAVKERGAIVFFDLKLIDGTSLDRLLRHRAGPLPVNVARWATSKIAEALHYAHSEGIVHRDMKPANVMVERRGDCIVTDFGIAKAKESPRLTMTGAVVGTPAYMSPEQCLGDEVTAASDQYSLGIMAYELLTGRVPFTGSMLTIQLGHVERTPTALRELVPEIPPEVSAVVMRMLAKAPAERWPTLALAAEALIEGLGSSESQMRREMSLLVHEMPGEAGRALPQTPNSAALPIPTPQRTLELAAHSRAESASTLIVVPLVKDAARDVSAQAATKTRRMRVSFALAGVATIAIVVLWVVFSHGKEDGTASVGGADSVAANVAANDSLLDQSDTTVVRLGVNPITVTLSVGDSAQLKALAFGPSGESVRRRVRWSSSDAALVRVNADGWIYARAKTKSNDPVFITATAAKKSSVSVVNVK